MSYETIVTQLQAFYSFLTHEPFALVVLLELSRTLAGNVAA